MMRAKPLCPAVFLALVLACGGSLLPAARQAAARAAKIKVTAEQANLREKPDIGSSILQQVPEGTVLETDRKDGEWYFVRYVLEDGGVVGGWIHESLVQVVEEAPAKPAAATGTAPAPRPARPGRTRTKQPALDFRSGPVPLEISFSLGAVSLGPRDLNNAAQGFVDGTAASAGLTAADAADRLRGAPVIGFDLSWRIGGAWTIGLGADYLRGANRSDVDLAGEGTAQAVSTKPMARVVPVKAVVRYYPGAGFYVQGAFGVYAVKAGYSYRRQGGGLWERWKGSASTTGLGGEAAFGGEWDLGPRTVLFLEAGLRVVSLTGLTGDGVYENSEGATVREAGTLYHFRQTAGAENDYPMVLVRTDPPSGTGISDVRRARINVSGTSFRAGLRYRF